MTDTAVQIQADPDAAVQPHPPRYWWLKRIALVSVAAVAIVVGLRLWWGYEAEHRLNALIAKYQAAGEPIFPEDFNPDPIPDAQNAAVYWQRAADTLDLSGELPQKFMEGRTVDLAVIGGHPVFFQLLGDELDALIAQNAECLSLVEQAAAQADAVWSVQVKSPMIRFLLPDLQALRSLAKFLRISALRSHWAGDDRTCLNRIDQMLSLSEDIGRMPFLISDLVSVACTALACDVIERAAPDLKVVDASSAEDPTAATREQAKALIDRLLDEGSARHGLKWAFYSERAFHFDNGRMLQSGQVTWQGLMLVGGSGGQSAWLSLAGSRIGYPIIATDIASVMEFMSALADATDIEGYQKARTQFAAPPLATGGIKALMNLYARTMMPSLSRAYLIHMRALVLRRMAAVALAIRLYEVDHDCRPETLDELVPDYLPAVPVDIFDSKLGPIRYVIHADQPLLYSVNKDDTDDGGDYLITPYNVNLDLADFVFFLEGDRPVSKDFQALADSLKEPQADEEGQRKESGDADEYEDAGDQP